MPRVANKIRPNQDEGSFSGRKRIPGDVQDEYAKLYGVRWEGRFNSGPVPIGLARAKYREWLSEIEARISNIRAERRGEGRILTPKQARALAGEWYQWFTSKHLAEPASAEYWEEEASWPYDLLRDAVWGTEPWPEGRDPCDDWWDANPKARASVRPIVADAAQTDTVSAHEKPHSGHRLARDVS